MTQDDHRRTLRRAKGEVEEDTDAIKRGIFRVPADEPRSSYYTDIQFNRKDRRPDPR